VHFRRGRLTEAERECRVALKADANNVEVLHLLGAIKLQQGYLEDAAASLDQALQLDPACVTGLRERGRVLRQLGRFQEALASLDGALAIDSGDATSHCERAALLGELGHHAEALAGYDSAIAIDPALAEAHFGRGCLLHALQRFEEAAASYRQALDLEPDHVECLVQLGRVLQLLNRSSEALAVCDAALALRPDHVPALCDRAARLYALGKPEDAIRDFDAALRLAPEFAETHYNRGVVLLALGRSDQAIDAFERALAIKPDYADALHNRGVVLLEQQRFGDALTSYRLLLATNPNYMHAAGNVAYASAQTCDWTDYSRTRDLVEAGVNRGDLVATPLVVMALSSDPATQLMCARTLVANRHSGRGAPLWRGERYRHSRIRIAYLSANFHDHAVAYLTAGLFHRHDRERFEVFGLSYGATTTGAMHDRIAESFDYFTDVRHWNEESIARLLRESEIDIAIDLMGFTGGARPDVLAMRPAPVQVNYLGYPGTMGAAFIDYILADRFVIPEACQSHYAEKVVYLPDTFQVNDSDRQTVGPAPRRGELGLPDSGFVFCSFNNNYKLNPDMFDVWMRILSMVDHSVLWLLGGNSTVIENLRREAERRGIEASRLIFAPKVPYADYLARYRAADLFLDTLPFNAGTTASDALWAGLPVLNVHGEAFASRMAGSLLQCAGLPELVTGSLADYEALAVRLAREPDALRETRERLANNRKTSPLFNTDRFCHHIEAAFTTMWERAERGEHPAGFAVRLAAT
jgi:predicted O-linked N-acetylglucosamine transferase (SPINDLY family)